MKLVVITTVKRMTESEYHEFLNKSIPWGVSDALKQETSPKTGCRSAITFVDTIKKETNTYHVEEIPDEKMDYTNWAQQAKEATNNLNELIAKIEAKQSL